MSLLKKIVMYRLCVYRLLMRTFKVYFSENEHVNTFWAYCTKGSLYQSLLSSLLNRFHPLPRGRTAIASVVVKFCLAFAVGGVFNHDGNAALASVVPSRS